MADSDDNQVEIDQKSYEMGFHTACALVSQKFIDILAAVAGDNEELKDAAKCLSEEMTKVTFHMPIGDKQKNHLFL